jgi:hypothetical protein
MKKIIPNSDLSLENLPEPTDIRSVFAFAMSFDGYDHFGSFEAAIKNAQLMKRESLTDLRNELFMCARAYRHCDGDEKEFLKRYAELLPLLKQAIVSGINRT